MLLNNNRITSIMLYDKQQRNPIAVITDNDIKCDKNIDVVISPQVGNLEDASIVKVGDILYYENDPEELYAVASTDTRFFTMYKASLNSDNSLTFNQEQWRAYPNNKYIATLKDFGLRNIHDDEEDDDE